MKHIEVVAAVIVKDNLIFCAQRKNGGETGSKWEFPGGKIENGESPPDALVREIKEELAVEIAVTDFIFRVEHQYEDFQINLHAYFAEILAGKPILQEHQASKWLSKSDLFLLDWSAADIPIVNIVASDKVFHANWR